MVEACRRGPSSARVAAVDEAPGNADALNLRRAGERFSVLPTI
jgi:acylphosphatase